MGLKQIAFSSIDKQQVIIVLSEYCPHGNLNDIFFPGIKLQYKFIIALFNQILDGVEFLITQNIAYPDLNLENTYLSEKI